MFRRLGLHFSQHNTADIVTSDMQSTLLRLLSREAYRTELRLRALTSVTHLCGRSPRRVALAAK